MTRVNGLVGINVNQRKDLIYLLKDIKLIDIDIKTKLKINIVGNYDSRSKYYNELSNYIKVNNLYKTIKFYGLL